MIIDDYISSGIIESYVMGLTSAEESAEFEYLCDLYPKLREARTEFERALEAKAFATAVTPPAFIKQKIFNSLLKEYIGSGIIESYVMGLASLQERKEFENMCLRYPELRKARIDFELSLETKALTTRTIPPVSVKDEIFASIRKETPAKVIPMTAVKSPSRNGKATTWAIAASVVVLLCCAGLVYSLYNKNQQLNSDMARAKDAKDKLDERARTLEEQMDNTQPPTKMVNVLTSPENKASINIFWDSTSTNVYLVVKDLPVLPISKKYHLWALNKGKYKSLGLFDAPEDDKLILKMNNVQASDSFSITIENTPSASDSTSLHPSGL